MTHYVAGNVPKYLISRSFILENSFLKPGRENIVSWLVKDIFLYFIPHLSFITLSFLFWILQRAHSTCLLDINILLINTTNSTNSQSLTKTFFSKQKLINQ